jgi:hypothetical protein
MNHEWEDAAGAYVGVFGRHSPGGIIEGYEKARLRKDKIFIPNLTRIFPTILLLARRCTGMSSLFVKCHTKCMLSKIGVTVLSINSTGSV